MISWKGGSLRGEEVARATPAETDIPRLVDYDKQSGEVVGFASLPAPPIGTPMTCLLDGKQNSALTISDNRPGSPP